MQAQVDILWLDRRVLVRIEQEASLIYPLETGGVLVGYVGDNGQPVVHEVVGPGPKALHLETRFEPDHAWQCEQLDSLFWNSSGQLVYLGDWHTHPNGSPTMSGLDRRTMRRIARHAEARISYPLMLIEGGSPGAWQLAVHQFKPAKWFDLLSSASALEIQLFS